MLNNSSSSSCSSVCINVSGHRHVPAEAVPFCACVNVDPKMNCFLPPSLLATLPPLPLSLPLLWSSSDVNLSLLICSWRGNLVENSTRILNCSQTLSSTHFHFNCTVQTNFYLECIYEGIYIYISISKRALRCNLFVSVCIFTRRLASMCVKDWTVHSHVAGGGAMVNLYWKEEPEGMLWVICHSGGLSSFVSLTVQGAVLPSSSCIVMFRVVCVCVDSLRRLTH